MNRIWCFMKESCLLSYCNVQTRGVQGRYVHSSTDRDRQFWTWTPSRYIYIFFFMSEHNLWQNSLCQIDNPLVHVLLRDNVRNRKKAMNDREVLSVGCAQKTFLQLLLLQKRQQLPWCSTTYFFCFVLIERNDIMCIWILKIVNSRSKMVDDSIDGHLYI